MAKPENWRPRLDSKRSIFSGGFSADGGQYLVSAPRRGRSAARGSLRRAPGRGRRRRLVLPVQGARTIHLLFIYPQWEIHINDLRWWLPLLAAVGVTIILLRRRVLQANWNRSLLFAWLFFSAALLPVLGLVDAYFMKYSVVADHYEYIALIAVAAIVAAAWTQWHDRTKGILHVAANTAAVALISGFAMLSRTKAICMPTPLRCIRRPSSNPACWLAYDNLGVIFLNTGRPHEAIDCFQHAARIRPRPEAYTNLGSALAAAGHCRKPLNASSKAFGLIRNYPASQ